MAVNRSTLNAALLVWVVGSLTVGVGIILYPTLGNAFFVTSVGIVLVVLGLMGTMPLVKRFFWPTRGISVSPGD